MTEASRRRISLGSGDAELLRLISFSEKFAHRHALPEAERARLLIILEELFTNAVNHGYDGEAATARIEVALGVKAGKLTIDFSDDGQPFDPLSATPSALDLPVADRPIGGLGLHLLQSLVDHFRYSRDSGRNRLVLIRNIVRSE